jgi:hypothetical protein
MVKPMINQSKKAVLMAKLAALNQTIANFKAKCQPAWLIIKQTWYIPFLWSLAWYSYWIFHSAIVLKIPFYEGNTSNYVGVAVSVTALLAAGYRARHPIKKSVGIAANSLLRKPTHTTQTDRPKQPAPNLKQAPTTETRQVQKEINPVTRPMQTISSVTSFSSGHDNKPPSRQSPKDFSSECLTCPNLISCTYRQKRIVELSTQNGNNTPCPYKSVVSKRNELKS